MLAALGKVPNDLGAKAGDCESGWHTIFKLVCVFCCISMTLLAVAFRFGKEIKSG